MRKGRERSPLHVEDIKVSNEERVHSTDIRHTITIPRSLTWRWHVRIPFLCDHTKMDSVSHSNRDTYTPLPSAQPQLYGTEIQPASQVWITRLEERNGNADHPFLQLKDPRVALRYCLRVQSCVDSLTPLLLLPLPRAKHLASDCCLLLVTC